MRDHHYEIFRNACQKPTVVSGTNHTVVGQEFEKLFRTENLLLKILITAEEA
jgi:hypothetical protein